MHDTIVLYNIMFIVPCNKSKAFYLLVSKINIYLATYWNRIVFSGII